MEDGNCLPRALCCLSLFLRRSLVWEQEESKIHHLLSCQRLAINLDVHNLNTLIEAGGRQGGCPAPKTPSFQMASMQKNLHQNCWVYSLDGSAQVLSKKNDSFMVYRWQINKNGCGLWIHFLRIEMSGWMQTGKLRLLSLSRAFTWGILSLQPIKSLTTHYIHIHSAFPSCNQALSESFDTLSQRCLEENHSILL